MKPNIGSTDRALRIVVGVAILVTGIYFKSWWALVGFVPLVTAVFRFCPAYRPFGVNTCEKTDRKD